MWKLYQEKLALSGLTEGASSMSCVIFSSFISSADSGSRATLVETVIHPRDINLLFVAYAGQLGKKRIAPVNIMRQAVSSYLTL